MRMDHSLAYDLRVPDESRVAELAQTIASEARLVRTLLDAVLAQRRAIAANDLEEVEASVFSIQRVLATLTQAKRNRRAVLEHLGWLGVGLERLPEVAGGDYTRELEAACGDLRGAVDALRRELTVNGEILRTVLHGGEAFLRALGGDQEVGGYGAGGQTEAPSASLLMNRRI